MIGFLMILLSLIVGIICGFLISLVIWKINGLLLISFNFYREPVLSLLFFTILIFLMGLLIMYCFIFIPIPFNLGFIIINGGIQGLAYFFMFGYLIGWGLCKNPNKAY